MSDADDSSNEQEDVLGEGMIEVPQLDPTGQTSQRTVEQRKKQEDLVKQTKRARGN